MNMVFLTNFFDVDLLLQSLVANEDFQHILRIQNTNVDGKQKVMFALTSIKGIGRRFANIICKKADVDMNKRLGLASELCSYDLFLFFFFLLTEEIFFHGPCVLACMILLS